MAVIDLKCLESYEKGNDKGGDSGSDSEKPEEAPTNGDDSGEVKAWLELSGQQF